jgi:CBS domain-containing protein
MVKSFKGEMIQKVKEDPQSITVEDAMSASLITFTEGQTIDEVMESLIDNHISGGPVINEDNEVIGMISEGDCLKEVVKGKYDDMPTKSGSVGEYMTRNVITVGPEVNLLDMAKKFLELRIRRFPVVKDGKLVGQISQKDVMKVIRNLKTSW